MQRLKVFVLILLLTVSTLGLGGCQKKETRDLRKQALPMVGGNPVSPLPTPNTQTSPLKQ